jgi:hypothetical protein
MPLPQQTVVANRTELFARVRTITSRSVGSRIARLLPTAVILISCCLCAAYVFTTKVYSVNVINFRPISAGKIAGTDYSFVVEKTYDWESESFVIKNDKEKSRTQIEASWGPTTEYTVLRHQNRIYLILKRPSNVPGITPDGYFVWNITGQAPYFVNSGMSCLSPKLLGNRLIFSSSDNCTNASEYRHNQLEPIIELR